ncbi:serine hydrolase [Ramlibacter tataouinensis]|uniref:beta-lactamase n=1 Tax=Ramlibacter tataouinensis (strain ATCC BAA-407 / DSM 14655 / LMG 21543 / TTB310) TaxID=365046 RepID=F5XZA3_RAMTT|nr:serine hydrolase [Ramlibacter tataouinensis]AEG93273.1 beta-lactamase precursor (Penicillinase)-like protein [Ramlibacter tataouinensis TTB310]
MLRPVLRRVWSACLLPLVLLSAPWARASDWQAELRQRIERIDRDTPGQLGVYVRRLDTGETFGHGADKPWYLGSAVKVPVAIAVLRQVDAGKLAMDSRVTLKETDKIDGPGELVWTAPEASYTIDSLLTRMLGVSDNTAANMLIRTVGEDALNQVAADLLGPGFKRITTLTQVRRDVYAQLHPDTRKLSNQQLVRIAGADMGPERVEAVRRALDMPASALQAKTMAQAYDRFYENNLNHATLEGYGRMLERLVRGQLLSPRSTERLFGYMKFGRRGDYRLEGGIPRSEPIIHKTGTQYRRACHMAVVNPQAGGAKAIVVATCAADMDDVREAGGIFRQVGEAVSRTMLAGAMR